MRKRAFAALAAMLGIVAIATAIVVRPVGAAGAGAPGAGGNVVVVTAASIDNLHWSTADTRPGGAVSFVPGPAAAPLGAGSLQMTSASSSAKAQLFNYDYVGTPLADFTDLSYADYRSSSSTNSTAQRVSLNMEVYLGGGTSGWTTLVYEPIYQAGGIGALQQDTWQTWHGLGSGVWWSTRTVMGANSVILHGSHDGNPDYWTWSQIQAAFPNAVVAGGVGFNIGSGWAFQFSGNADALVVGVSGHTTTFNFEPDASVCKHGGWQSYGYKNQGDCVSNIATGGRNPGQ